MSDDSIEIGSIQKSNGEEVRVALKHYEGTWYLDVRLFYKDRATGEFRPTKKGLTLKPSQIGELREYLEVAEEEAKGEGLL